MTLLNLDVNQMGDSGSYYAGAGAEGAVACERSFHADPLTSGAVLAGPDVCPAGLDSRVGDAALRCEVRKPVATT